MAQHQGLRTESATAGRWPATAVFLLNGLTLATYIARSASIRAEHRLSDGGLGLVGALFAVSALSAMQFVGPLVRRAGAPAVLRTVLILLPGVLALLGWSRPPALFGVAVMALGCVHGITDTAMNAYAVDVERAGGRPITSGCHAAWSVSAILASLAAVPLVHAGVTTRVHFTVMAGVCLLGGLLVGPTLRPVVVPGPGGPGGPATALAGWRQGWSRTAVLLGLSGTALMVCDGASLGWSAIFLHDDRGASLALATAAVTGYTAGQTCGRLTGDRLRGRFGARAVFRGLGLVGVAGFAAAVGLPWPAVAVAGFTVLGLGSSLLLPLTFSAVGDVAAGAGTTTSMSRFTTFAYAGILLGPAAIGWSAELVGLTATLAALVPVLGIVVLLSRAPVLIDARTAVPRTASVVSG